MKSILLSISILMLSVAPTIADSFESWNIGLGNDDVIGIAMVSDTDGWALLMSFSMYHWNGQEWTRYEGPIGSADGKGGSLGGLEYYDPTHIYNYWLGLRMYDGTSWVEFEPQPPFGLDDIEVINPNSIWGGGDDHNACYWNGTEWTEYVNIPGLEDHFLWCIGFGSAEEGWAGGTMGAMSHFYDGAWHAYGPITDGWLQNADFANNTYGVMDGPNVLAIYYNSAWEAGGYLPDILEDCYAINDEYLVLVSSNFQTIYILYQDTYVKGYYTGAPLYCVHATSPNSIWAGGENGYVCHWVWDGDGVQPSSLGQIKAHFPPQTDLSPSNTTPQTQNDCDPLCPQMEFE